MNGAVSKKRWLMEIGIGFMLGRVWVFSINPFGLAYLCASGVYPAGRGLVFLSVLAGFITKAKGLDFLHYIMMTGLLWFEYNLIIIDQTKLFSGHFFNVFICLHVLLLFFDAFCFFFQITFLRCESITCFI